MTSPANHELAPGGSRAQAGSVDVQHVTKVYAGGAAAVSNASVLVAPGEFLCLLGPSGSGKTTLLRIIGGLEAPDDGRVLIDGEDVTTLPPARRRTNMVFQQHALFPHLSVRDNVAFGPKMRRVPAAETDRQVTRALEMVRLPGLDSRLPHQLSGGQRQRVAIARAIVNEPAVLLLDEPMASLDLRLRTELQSELRRLHRSLGSKFIAVTHDQNEAMAMADRIAVMNDGRIEQIGTPDEIYRRPASAFVAQFIGHTNWLHGQICARLGKGLYVVNISGIRVPCAAPEGIGVGEWVSLSVREELVTVEPPGRVGETSGIRLDGVVTDRSFLGSELRYTIQLAGDWSVAAEVRADLGREPYPVGASVLCGWRPEQAMVFKDG